MSSTGAERQKKYKEKMRGQCLSLVQVWVHNGRIVEIKSIAARMVERGESRYGAKPKTAQLCSILVRQKGIKGSSGNSFKL